jgi:hypothetical protein
MYHNIKAAITIATTLMLSFWATPAQADIVDRDVLNGGGRVEYSHFLPSHERTVFTVVGDGDGDIDCFLYDEHGNRVEQDTRPVDGCVVFIMPAWTGRFTFVLRNNGRQASAYRYYVE